MSNTKINIVEVPINELRASEYNPRTHSKEQARIAAPIARSEALLEQASAINRTNV
jgi:hypothetical protein